MAEPVFQDMFPLGEDTTPPYSYNWAGVGDGCYMITAKAIDDIGGEGTDQVDLTVGFGCGQGPFGGRDQGAPGRLVARVPGLPPDHPAQCVVVVAERVDLVVDSVAERERGGKDEQDPGIDPNPDTRPHQTVEFEQARALGKPAYTVFSNATLAEIARRHAEADGA